MSTKATASRKKKAPPPASLIMESPAAANAASAVIISPTQQEEEEESVEEDAFGAVDSHAKIASCHCTIVGIRYYKGTAHAGEYVTLVREPTNPYDGNAIRVDNMTHEKVGHIKREQAALMAPFMDQAETLGLSLMATIPRPGSAWNMPCEVEFFAQAPSEELEERATTLANQLQTAFGRRYSFRNHMKKIATKTAAASAAVKSESTMETKRMDWTAMAKELDHLFEQQTAKQLQGLPTITAPPFLKTKLLPYQQDGLQWMVQQDTTPKIPFYTQQTENKKKVWHCSITNSSQPNPPNAVQGGILADAMGLGKTLQTIAMMLAAAPPSSTALQCTLIVCPVSVMANWQHQIEQHVEQGALNVALYQGTNRANLSPEIPKGNIHVLLASYHTLAAEYSKLFKHDTEQQQQPKKKKPRQAPSIFECPFHRIVCDEAHVVRNTKAKLFQAVTKIQATRKWCLTGTPFVNRAEDVYALLHFLGVEPLHQKPIYQRAISIPMQQGDDAGLACLRLAMAHVALRRSKAGAKIQLVDKTVLLHKVSFPDTSPHKTVYDALFGTVRTAFQAVLQQDDDNNQQVLRNYSNIFEKLLRLRQACCSARLVPAERRERALEVWKELLNKRGSDPNQLPQLTAKEGLELLEKLKGAFAASGDDEGSKELPECAVCLMEMDESQCIILKGCGHVYCEPCIGRVCAGNHKPNCPLCRQPFGKKDMIKKSMASTAATRDDKTDEEEEAAIDDKSLGASPKIAALLETIQTTMKPDEKGVIFSQFTSFLDLIQAAMKEAGHSFTRLDGSMSTTKRIEGVRAFCSEEDDSPRFILCSLHAAGTGINLTRANVCFMMDCWWNTAVENQAMDRVHRIGQTRPVCVHRFVMKDSLEERIVALQEIKSMQAKGAMQKLKPEEKKKARLDDLKGLLMIESDSE